MPYQTTHNTGGAIMGDNPKNSVVNKYLQSWDVPNVFSMGAGAFPQNAGYNPTGTVAALAYHVGPCDQVALPEEPRSAGAGVGHDAVSHSLARALASSASAVAILGVAGFAVSQMPRAARASQSPRSLPTELLTQPIDDSTAQCRAAAPRAVSGGGGRLHVLPPARGRRTLRGRPGTEDAVRRDLLAQYHLRPADRNRRLDAAISSTSAMHDGNDVQGENLYPAFPYPWFRRVSREDDDAIFAYLEDHAGGQLHAAEKRPAIPAQLSLHGRSAWNLLFLDSHDFQTDPGQSAEWNRGAYLVNGLGHCGGCHTPKNALGADKSEQELHGGDLDNWVAPDLTGNDRTGLGALEHR